MVKKRGQKAKTAIARAAKASRSADGASSETCGHSQELSEEEPGDSSSDSISSAEGFEPQEVFDEWMTSLRLEQRKMLAVILMESFKQRQKMKVRDAAREAGSIVGFN